LPTTKVSSAGNRPPSSNRQHYEIDDCLEDNREDYSNYRYVNYIRMRIMEFLQAKPKIVRTPLYACMLFCVLCFCKG